MRRSVFWTVVMIAAAVSTASAQAPGGKDKPDYKAGQVWLLVGGGTITVLKVDEVHRIGRVIHIRVDNVPVPACQGIHLTRTIDHIALTEKMMRKSSSALIEETTELPDENFDAYRAWQKQKNPIILKDQTVADEIRRSLGMPLICNFLPAQIAMP
jgi:hypothetical protein